MDGRAEDHADVPGLHRDRVPRAGDVVLGVQINRG